MDLPREIILYLCIWMILFYTYVLFSEKDGKKYTGYTKDIKLRFQEHNNGLVASTKNRRPLKLIYFEACVNQQDATRHEK